MNIHVRGVQRDAEGTENVVETRALGTYAEKNGKHYLRYADDALIEGRVIPTILKFSSEGVVLIRKEPLAQEMRFVPMQNVGVWYHSPYGMLALKIDTKKFTMGVTPAGGTLELGYRLFVEGEFQSKNTLRVVWSVRDIQG